MKITISFLFFFLISCLVYSQEEYFIDTDFRYSFVDIEKDNNGDFVAITMADSLDYHYWGGLIKFDSDFNYEIFDYNIDTADYFLFDFLITEDNNYLIAGTIGLDEDIGYNVNNLYFLLIDENLNLLSENILPLPENYDNPQIKMFQTQFHRNYVIVHQQEADAVFKAYIELSEEGAILGQAFYNLAGMAMDAFSKPNSNNGFYVLQTSASPSAYCEIVEVDTNLSYTTTLLPLVVNGEIYYIGQRGSCKWLNDSVYILCTEGSYGLPDGELWIYKMNANHEFLTEPFIIGQENITDNSLRHRGIDWIDKDHIYVATWLWPSMYAVHPYYVAIINENFDVLGAKSIGGEESNLMVNSLLATDDGGCVVVGGQRNIEAGDEYDWNGYVAFFSPDDIITSATETPNPYDSDYLLFPNPGNGQFIVQSACKGVRLKMYDQKGKLALDKQLPDDFRKTINTDQLKPGFYLCQLMDRYGNTEYKKWIKN